MDIPFLGFIAQVRNTDRTDIYCWACAPRLWHEELQDAYGNTVQPITEEKGEVCSLCGGSIGEGHLFDPVRKAMPDPIPGVKTQMGRYGNPVGPQMQNLPIRRKDGSD